MNASDPDLDVPDWRERASRMVQRLHLPDRAIAAAMREVPRHRFVDRPWRPEAYVDAPVPLGAGATISAPHMVALQLQYAQLSGGLRVLEVGCGTGYLLALLGRLVGPSGTVVGVEIEEHLAEKARALLTGPGGRGSTFVDVGDGGRGSPAHAPFDRILVSHAVEAPVPEAWARQGAPGARLILPLDEGDGTFLDRFVLASGAWRREVHGPPCLFVGSKAPRA